MRHLTPCSSHVNACWYNSSIAKRNIDGDPRFWYARGTVKVFLDKLYTLALAPMRRKVDRTTDHLYLYLPNRRIHNLAKEYGSAEDLFKALESTYISELISEVRIRVKIRNTDQSLTFRELSEGEQQMLTVLGLLRFTKEDESLFLLDEPDTHLNPAWSVNYLDHLRGVVGEEPSSQIIMTTHDPLVISGLGSNDVRILELDRENGRYVLFHPKKHLLGWGTRIFLPAISSSCDQQLVQRCRSCWMKNESWRPRTH